MWTYFGSKSNIIQHYPPPKYGKIIEPFAGTARYALRFHDRDILLVDKYEVIVDLWNWLKVCPPNDILTLPRLKAGDLLDEVQFDCEPAKNLIGFIIGYGRERPARTCSPHILQRPNRIEFALKTIASHLWKIKHWNIIQGSYLDIENQQATYFIDPPYQHGGRKYVHNNRKIDFVQLKQWCMTRDGQAIVCENNKATWMDFKPFRSQRGTRTQQQEMIWTNEPSAFDNIQTKLFI